MWSMMHLFSLEDRSIDHGDNLESRKRENDKRASGNDCLSINVHQAVSKKEARETINSYSNGEDGR